MFQGAYKALLFAVLLCGGCCAFGFDRCDLTEDGIVSLPDFAILAESWTETLPWGPDGLPDQLVSHWQLDGNAVDIQSSFDGIVKGNPVWMPKSQARIGSGAVFMDGQDYIAIDTCDYPAFYGSMTVGLWVKTSGSDQDQISISKGSSNWQIGIQGVTNKTFFSFNDLTGSKRIYGTEDIADGKWHQLAGVFDHGRQKILLYVDGGLEAEADVSGTISPNDCDIWIGGNPEPSEAPMWWHGYIDNVQIYNFAMNEHELFHRKIIHVDIKTGNDNSNGQGRLAAHKTIQHAIDSASDGDLILVWPGIYTESIMFSGKAITVKSASDAAVIRSPGDYAVMFYFGEQEGSRLENFIIKDSEVGISVSHSNPTLKQLTLVKNDYAIDLWGASTPHIEGCISWYNQFSDIFAEAFVPVVEYSCIEREFEGEGNISGEPLFVDIDNGDFHLQSMIGRYQSDGSEGTKPKPHSWATDDNNSPCIDAGRATINPMFESMPNGGRLNIGAYGGSPFASKSQWPLIADLNCNGQVYTEDLLILLEDWLKVEN